MATLLLSSSLFLSLMFVNIPIEVNKGLYIFTCLTQVRFRKFSRLSVFEEN